MDEQKFSYDQAVKELEKIIQKMDSGDMAVDELSENVKKAAELLRQCRKKLRSTEESVKKILEEIDEEGSQ